ncbi:MAG: wapA14, partial [Verrucomicrobiales bacterium]|nr:wapA14 [Verrucomicrobiales bacterium]
YDADGNRVSKTTSDGINLLTTAYLVEDRNPTGYAQVMEEWTSTASQAPALNRTYVYGLDLVSQKQGGSVTYYGYDGLGSTRYLSDSNASTTDTYTYDAFGIQIASTGSTLNQFRYTGEQWDSDLGMYYLRARYYKPELGRFWTMDSFEGSIEDPSSLHKYTYGYNNPVSNCDFSGNAVHHKVPQSLWSGFSSQAKEFFDSADAVVEAAAHDFSSHGGYNSRVDELMKEWMREKGLSKAALSKAQARNLLEFLEKDAFVSGFNRMVPSGSKALTKWVYEKGHLLLPQSLRARALKRATALAGRKGWLGSAVKKGTGPFLSLGLTLLTAERMYAEGCSDKDVSKAIVDDLYFGVPGMAEQGVNTLWGEANSLAAHARSGAFSYLDYDADTAQFDGSTSLIIADEAVNALLERQNRNVADPVTVGGLYGGAF